MPNSTSHYTAQLHICSNLHRLTCKCIKNSTGLNVLMSGTVLHTHPENYMSSFFSVLGAKGSVRPTSDCTAQGQDEVGLGQFFGPGLYWVREGKEDGAKQKGIHESLQTYLWSLGGLEPSLAHAQAAGAAGRSQEDLEEAQLDLSPGRLERGYWQCF